MIDAVRSETFQAALVYRDLGWHPLPSSARLRRPPFLYGAMKDRDPDMTLFRRYGTRNVQLVLGRRFGLVAVDLDGPHAPVAWEALAAGLPAAPTWEADTPSGGRHLYYAVAPSGPPLATGLLWGGPPRDGWPPHTRIDFLGERALLTAPPSVRLDPPGRYAWRPGRSPGDLPKPAPLPGWLARLAASRSAGRGAARPTGLVAPPLLRRSAPPAGGPSRPRYRIADVDLALGDDKPAVARAWGLRLASDHPYRTGWMPCRALDREDRRPSASFHAARGIYTEPLGGPCAVVIPFYALGAALGAFRDWADCLNHLGDSLGVRPIRRPA